MLWNLFIMCKTTWTSDYDLAEEDVGGPLILRSNKMYLKLCCSLCYVYKRSKVTFNFLTKAALWSAGYTVQTV